MSQDLLVICRPSGVPEEIRASLQDAGIMVTGEKRVQGFEQAPGLLSGSNTVLTVNKQDQGTADSLSPLLAWAQSQNPNHVYVPSSLEETNTSIAKLLPTPTVTRQGSPEQSARPESDRKFTFEEPSAPLTRSAIESLPESSVLDEQLVHQDSLSRTTQSLSISEHSSPAPDVQPSPTSKAPSLQMPPPRDRQASSVSAETASSTGSASRTTTSVKSLRSPAIEPRGTRSSALRSGKPPSAGSTPRSSVNRRQSTGTSERSRSSTGNYPGYKRQSLNIQVASTSDPTVAVRQNRAAALRAGTWTEADEAALQAQRDARRAQGGNSTANTPGYKRASLQLDVKSTQQPTIAPRMTKAAALRMGLDAAPNGRSTPTQPAQAPTSKASKRASISVPSTGKPSLAPRPNRAAELRAAGGANSLSGPVTSSTQSAPRALLSKNVPSENKNTESPLRRKIAPTPAITPRPNRSALLRAANSGN